MKRVYLSIDLDYWLGHDAPNRFPFIRQGGEFLTKVLRFAEEQGVSVDFRHRHHHLLYHMDSCGPFDVVVNIDYHSDLFDESREKEFYAYGMSVNEGSWANYVDIQPGKTDFIWYHPDANFHDGRCDSRSGAWGKIKTKYRKLYRRQGLAQFKKDFLSPNYEIVGVGICGFENHEHFRNVILRDDHDWIDGSRAAIFYHETNQMYFFQKYGEERHRLFVPDLFPLEPVGFFERNISCSEIPPSKAERDSQRDELFSKMRTTIDFGTFMPIEKEKANAG